MLPISKLIQNTDINFGKISVRKVEVVKGAEVVEVVEIVKVVEVVEVGRSGRYVMEKCKRLCQNSKQ